MRRSKGTKLESLAMRAVMSTVSDDLIAWRAQTGVDRFDEMWEGILHMNAAPHGDHQMLQDDLREWLKHWWARPRQARVFSQRNVAKPEEWPTNYRIPDLVLLPRDRQEFDAGDYVGGPPLVVVEIRSPNDESYEKLPFYAHLGVPEVWIIERDAKISEIFLLHQGEYASLLPEDGWLTSPATGVQLSASGTGRLNIQMMDQAESRGELPEE